jgi:vanillate O-demethylase monooxygenase subunit
MFLRNSWYVFGWSHDLADAHRPLGRVILGEPIVVWRDGNGGLHAMEGRCPHRHAPLSMGRVEGDRLRCMYHGMEFDGAGRCVAVPLMPTPPDVRIRVYPIVEKNDWLWVWTGEPEAADEALIPDAWGLNDPGRPMRSNSIEYEANYQLVHDNLCDLSHLDFVHESTLMPATGTRWSDTAPRVTPQGRSIRIERWFEQARAPGYDDVRVDVWSSYEFTVPGVFIMRGARYPAGTAAACGGQPPVGVEPINQNIEQQAVTPITATRTAYHYATGLIGSTPAMTLSLASRMDVVMAAFEEDRAIIEAQQRIWDMTPADHPKQFLPQDKAPNMFRKMLKRLMDEEASAP